MFGRIRIWLWNWIWIYLSHFWGRKCNLPEK